MAENKLKRHLTIADLGEITNNFWKARERVRFIGLCLKIEESTMDSIAKSTTDMGEMFRQMLKAYLQGNGCQPITRERLVQALETKMVGLPQLAGELRKIYSPASSGSDESTDDTSEHCNQEPTLSQEASGTSASDSGVYNSENTSDEQQEHKAMSNDAIREVMVVFAKLYEGVRSTCTSGVSYQEVKKIILPVADYPSQLETGIATAQSPESVWSYLDKYKGWVNSRPIEMLATTKGNDCDKENVKEFQHKRKWLLGLLEKNYYKRTKELVLKLDMDYDEFKDENLEMVRLHLCSLLRCHVTVLKVERGCVEITVAIPAETAEDIFPLSPAMREEFQRAFPSIISVECGNIQPFANTHNSEEKEEEEKEVTESQDEEREEGESEKRSGDEKGYSANESGSDWSTEEEQESGEWHAGQSQKSNEPQMTPDRDINITREQEADVEQEGGRTRGEESESRMAGSGEEDRNLGTHISVIRELKNGDLRIQ